MSVATQDKIDIGFVRDCFNTPGHAGKYAEHAKNLGLFRSERALVYKYFSKDDRILDIGCGAGRTTIPLYELGYCTVIGVDLTPAMIDHARSLAEALGHPIPFEVGDATSLRFDDASFDAALFSAQGLMCIPGRENRLEALREARRVLRPGGCFIFTTHDRDQGRRWASYWGRERVRWEQGRQDPRFLDFGDRIVDDEGEPTFIHIPTRRGVVDMLSEAGLTLVEDKMRAQEWEKAGSANAAAPECRMWVTRRPAE